MTATLHAPFRARRSSTMGDRSAAHTGGRLRRSAFYGLLIAWTLASLFPFYFTLATSLKLKRDVLDPTSWFFVPTLDNYVEIFTSRNILHYLGNSAFISVGTVVPSLALGLLTAYGMTRFGVVKERSVAATLLSFRMIPAIAVVIPYFLIAQLLGLIDTHLILVIAYTTMNLPLAIWMLRGFMRQIPIEIDEAAQLDGATRWRILWGIHLPTIAPGLASTGILLLIQSWNEFAFAQFLTSTGARTFPTTAGFFLSITGTNFGEMAAVAIVGTLPPLTFAILMRRRLVSGLSYGAV
ncbi:carbohydrate ABC transporter permease [Georgenia satyanarayanai]|uniref:carbohydrate ABC transporter permease n=1 Tax=Georgenia satyanarayanai TaxID=860221 RepID=UPI00203A6F1B|nr:carbohydrate ABC transporter permease [Georgenia satyanarayanai]MCM3661397.1 carbohydrate ABC transporter permease [Georgenia satyanarayanai]